MAESSVVRVNLSMLPAELVELDTFAQRLARPGWKPNRSQAAIDAVRAILNAEALGLLTIEDGRIYLERRRADRG